MHADPYRRPYRPSGLPDPERDRQFYEGVPLRRLFAYVIDALLAGLLTLAALIVFALPSLGLIFFVAFLVWAAVDFCYRVLTLARGSATPGMRFMGIELRGPGGHRLDAGTAVLHTILFYLCMAFTIAQIVSIALMVGSASGRGLPDLALGTAMINRPL